MRMIAGMAALLSLTGCVVVNAPVSAPQSAPASTRPEMTPTPKVGRLPLMADSPEQVAHALGDAGMDCNWKGVGQGEFKCASPEAMLFVDPAPHLGGSLMESKKNLYRAMYADRGGAVVSGTNWVVGASSESSRYALRLVIS